MTNNYMTKTNIVKNTVKIILVRLLDWTFALLCLIFWSNDCFVASFLAMT